MSLENGSSTFIVLLGFKIGFTQLEKLSLLLISDMVKIWGCQGDRKHEENEGEEWGEMDVAFLARRTRKFRYF